LSVILATGYQGPLLLEDAVDLAGMAVMMGKTVHPSKWIDELRIEAEGDAMASMFGI
jgi:hypothetical protein